MVITLDKFLYICGAITAVCVAAGWLIKIAKGANKPYMTMKQEVEDGMKRTADLEAKVDYLYESNKLTLDALYQLLDHIKTNNNTGGMSKCQAEIFRFLNEK